MHVLLALVKLNRFSQDRITWKFDRKGVLLVTLLSKAIIDNQGNEVNSYSFAKSIWKGLTPPKVEIFAWFILISRLSTKDRLHKFGIIPQDQLNCCLGKSVEDLNHLLFSYDFA